MRFGFHEVDVDLSFLEFLGVIGLGVVICVTPFILKMLLIWGGM